MRRYSSSNTDVTNILLQESDHHSWRRGQRSWACCIERTNCFV